jgi:hypothetical protein
MGLLFSVIKYLLEILSERDKEIEKLKKELKNYERKKKE